MKTLEPSIHDEEKASRAQEREEGPGAGKGELTTLLHAAQESEQLWGRKRLTVVVRFAIAGAILGLVVGALYGIPAGMMNCSAMGCPFTTSVTLLVVITVYWVLGGACMGAIVGMDRLEQGFYTGVKGVRRQ